MVVFSMLVSHLDVNLNVVFLIFVIEIYFPLGVHSILPFKKQKHNKTKNKSKKQNKTKQKPHTHTHTPNKPCKFVPYF